MQKLSYNRSVARAQSFASRFRRLAALAALALFGAHETTGQATKVVRPRPQIFSFFSLSILATPLAVNFPLVHGGTTTGSSSITLVTAYVGGASYTGSLVLYAAFGSASSALSCCLPIASIPSSAVFGLVPTGLPTSYTAFTQTTPYTGASGLALFNLNSIPALTGTRTDVLSLKIDLTSLPQLPAGIYIGTLSFEIQAM